LTVTDPLTTSTPEFDVADPTTPLPAPRDPFGSINTSRPSTEEVRESLRGVIAYALLGILAFVILGSFVTLWFDWGTGADVDALLTILFAPLIGLVGAVTGFYYGERSSASKDKQGSNGSNP